MIARVTVSEPTFNATASSSYIVNITLGAAIGTQQIQSDWNQSDNTALDYIKNKPAFTAPVNADWNAVSGLAEILNKPSIPAAQVNSDWNSVSGVSQILNKPTIPAAQIQADLLQSNTGAMDYVKNKLESFIVSASNFNTDITTGTYKAYIFVPYNFYITAVEAAMATAPVGSSAIFDLTVDGVSILSTLITIETGENTSYTATMQPVVSTPNVTAGKFILVAFTQVGASTPGKDVEITVKGYRV